MSTEVKKIHKKLVAMNEAMTSSDVSGIEKTWNALKPYVEELLDDARTPAISAPQEQWTRALLHQAREDLAAAERLATPSKPGDPSCESIVCMLLQMTFEKIGKAQLARSARDAFIRHRMSHATASKLLEALKSAKLPQFGQKFKSVLPFVKALERAHPALTKHGPHLEYPWEDGTNVATPSKLQVVRDIFDPLAPHRLRNLIQLANALIRDFDDLFP